MKSIVSAPLFFDKIVKTEEIVPDYEHVYDLSVEDHNFTANNLIVHNSYGVSVLFEELLDRKKEDGRIAVVVLDPHGEYSSFAEPVKGSKHKDYSDKTKLVKDKYANISIPSEGKVVKAEIKRVIEILESKRF